MLSQVSERLKFLVAFRPGPDLPDARRPDGGHLPEPHRRPAAAQRGDRRREHEQRAYGDFLDKDARYARCEEFLSVVRALWAGETVDLPRRAHPRRGRHARPDPRPGARHLLRRLVAGGGQGRRQARRRLPDLGRAAGRGREKIDWVRKLAADEGREVRFGIRLHTITRDTADEAWARGGPAARRASTERDRRGAGGPAPQRVRGSAPDARPAPGQPRRPRDLTQPVGGRRPGARRRGHRARRQPRAGGRPDRGVPRRSASTSSSCRATRTSRPPTGSARECSRSWPSGACGKTPGPPR